jgi:hypothetical protein
MRVFHGPPRIPALTPKHRAGEKPQLTCRVAAPKTRQQYGQHENGFQGAIQCVMYLFAMP